MKIQTRVVLLILALALAASLAGCGGNAPTPAEPAPPAMEEPAPPAAEEPADEAAPGPWSPDIAFSTVDSTGTVWTDACFAESKLTMINLWAYWCPPCVGELPDLQALSENYADRGLRILGISDEADEADNEITAAEAGVTYPRLRYTGDFDHYMNTGFVPTTIFVDANGRVLDEAYVGSRSYEEWALVIESYLDQAG